MLRREFLHGLAAAAVPSILPTSLAAAETNARHGDLLIQSPATDHRRLIWTPHRPRSLRLLQITDTHFHPGDGTTRATERMLRGLIERERPDFIVHTGDFVNNDSDKRVEWSGLDVVNGLGVPWTLCFGNHDYPVQQAEGSRPLDEIRQGMENGYQGYIDKADGRHYCYRYDLLTEENAKPSACLFFFQVGYAEPNRRISDAQLAWFAEQMEKDAAMEIRAPITVFVHIPLTEYHLLYESGKAIGVKGESVCYDNDQGESFKHFSRSGRVVGVFCGHDHVNNYHGDFEGIDLVYGRVSGWGGYGPLIWKRGGRLITFDLANPRPLPVHKEVF